MVNWGYRLYWDVHNYAHPFLYYLNRSKEVLKSRMEVAYEVLQDRYFNQQ